NGYLLDKPTKEESIEEITDRMADKIVQYFNNGPTSPQQVSYDIATPFKTAEMINKWQNLVDEVLYD
ncbi:MAG: accessory Sec system glycosyltransferase GtfA, partial [Staphylococcus lugdunensis]|nr:accessory Sec system glycosyltransferase GtfA [Staphylococcus lugdunensis]